MKYCVLCDRTYPDESAACEVDGSTLRNARPNVDAFVGKIINGRYRVLEKLGEGGMSIVYVAEQINVARKVALKIMHGQYSSDQEFVRRFRQEARLAASLNHPNIVQVYDFDQAEDGTLFIAMEYLRGTNLKELIRQGPVELPTAVHLGIQIAEGLGSAHHAGVIHRDIKPENIMVLPQEQQIRLLDFGIARLGDAGSTTKLTRAGVMMGTPAYMAPEQIEGGEVTERTDIYALGIVLYEMLCGVAPFRAPTPAAVLMKHLREIATAPRKVRKDIPVPVERIITQAIEKLPERRQANAEEIARALRSVRAKLPEELPRTAFLSTEILDSSEIDAHRFSLPASKRLLHKFNSWFSRRSAIPDRSADLRGREDLSETAAIPVTGVTLAETMVTSEPAASMRGKRVHWKLAAGVGLFALLALGLTILYRQISKEPVQTTSPVVPTEPPAPVPSDKILFVSIQGGRGELSVGEQAKFALAVERENGSRDQRPEEVRWSSSNPSVLESAGDGEFIAKSAGSAEILAEYQSVTAVPFRLTVKGAAEPAPVKKVEIVSLAIAPTRAEIEVNERLALRVTGKYSDGREQELKGVRWESNDRSVAAIEGSGELEGRRAGRARIVATYGGVRSEPLIVSVRAPQVKEVVVPRKETIPPPPPPPTRESPVAEAPRTQRQQQAEIKEPPVKKAPPPPEVPIGEYIRSAKKHRDRGDYTAALVELEKAKRIDQNNQEIQAEIVVTTRACNAERILGRPDLKC